ncbi:hypothetical protein KKG41_00565 [Patescibacteria group bacterium]|nr:hypothetical protein [Patescibacteria group bacterium]MBU1890298.1 hypothetical protein [Patescibacteria group bacterium]
MAAWIEAVIEAYVGPMRAGKTERAMGFLRHMMRMESRGRGVPFAFVRPVLDNRQDNPTEIVDHNRTVLQGVEAVIIDHKKPEEMLTHPLIQAAKVVLIDEAQFFDRTVCRVVLDLFLAGKHIKLFGVDTDHLGRTFITIGGILGLADTKVIKMDTAICEVGECRRMATRTIRMIKGKPDSDPSREFVVEDRGATYVVACTRCFVDIMTKADIEIH